MWLDRIQTSHELNFQPKMCVSTYIYIYKDKMLKQFITTYHLTNKG